MGQASVGVNPVTRAGRQMFDEPYSICWISCERIANNDRLADSRCRAPSRAKRRNACVFPIPPITGASGMRRPWLTLMTLMLVATPALGAPTPHGVAVVAGQLPSAWQAELLRRVGLLRGVEAIAVAQAPCTVAESGCLAGVGQQAATGPLFVEPPVPPAPSAVLVGTFWSGAVGGAVLLATGAVFGVLSETTAANVNERFEHRTLNAADRPLYDTARSQATVANVAFAVGAAALVTAAVSYFIDPRVADDAAPARGR